MPNSFLRFCTVKFNRNLSVDAHMVRTPKRLSHIQRKRQMNSVRSRIEIGSVKPKFTVIPIEDKAHSLALDIFPKLIKV